MGCHRDEDEQNGDGMSGHGDEVEQHTATPPWVRPQALLLTFCGAHMPAGQAVYSGSLVKLLQRVGVGEHATRSTLARMCRRGLLVRHRVGKRVYFEVSARAATMLAEAAERVWREGAVNRGWDGNWTLLGFSLPESRRADRHLLRSRLTWAGFGLLQHGLWISPHGLTRRRCWTVSMSSATRRHSRREPSMGWMSTG